MEIEFCGTTVIIQDDYIECLSKDCDNCKFKDGITNCDLCDNPLECCGALVQEYYREVEKMPLIIPCCYCNAELKSVRRSFDNG